MDRLISEKDVLDILRDYYRAWFLNDKKFMDAVNAIKAIPSAEPKKGHWIKGEVWEDTNGGWGRWQKCSVCRQSKHHKTNFCPNCGARMVKPQESEDKE